MIHPIDSHVGKRLYSIRAWRSVTQCELGKAAGISSQQVQKYENGLTRISASRLFQFAQTLRVEVSDFFRGLKTSETYGDDCATKLGPTTPQGLHLVNAFESISDENTRRYVLGIVTALAGEHASQGSERARAVLRKTSKQLYAENGRYG